jgi:hypothetical protein
LQIFAVELELSLDIDLGIPWADMISLRNRLIHGYDLVDFDILWQIVTHDLPELIMCRSLTRYYLCETDDLSIQQPP